MMFLTRRPLSDDIYAKQKTTGNPPKTQQTHSLKLFATCPQERFLLAKAKYPHVSTLRLGHKSSEYVSPGHRLLLLQSLCCQNNSILTQVIFNLKGGLTAWITPSNQVGEKNVTFTSELSLHVMPKKQKSPKPNWGAPNAAGGSVIVTFSPHTHK